MGRNLRCRIYKTSVTIFLLLSFYLYYFYNQEQKSQWEDVSKKVRPPGIILPKSGGVGNQLFRFACSYALSRKLNVPLYIDISNKNKTLYNFGLFKYFYEYNTDARPFSLHHFNIPFNHTIGDYSLVEPVRASLIKY
jgi:hypothetical protein